MQLNEESKKKIMNLWEERVRASSKEADTRESLWLRNNLPQLLDHITSALLRKQTLSEIEASDEFSKVHGKGRSLVQSYTIEQVLREYSILRIALLEILGSDGPISLEDQVIIHTLINDGEMIAGTQFSDSRRLVAESLSQDLKRSNDDLERFAAIAAHDLRSPIATISSVVANIRDTIKNPSAEMEEDFTFVNSATQSILLLIERLLTYASIGKSEWKTDSIDLNKVVQDVVAKLGKIVSESQAKVIYQGLPIIKGDASIVGQLFQNLIANSIKFRSTASPIIEIRLEQEDEQEFKFSVKDNGIGFTSKQAETIFEPFKRLDTTNKYEGSGLGLSTARRVVEVLGGKIWVESEKGKGTKFFFTVAK